MLTHGKVLSQFNEANVVDQGSPAVSGVHLGQSGRLRLLAGLVAYCVDASGPHHERATTVKFIISNFRNTKSPPFNIKFRKFITELLVSIIYCLCCKVKFKIFQVLEILRAGFSKMYRFLVVGCFICHKTKQKLKFYKINLKKKA